MKEKKLKEKQETIEALQNRITEMDKELSALTTEVEKAKAAEISKTFVESAQYLKDSEMG